MIRLLSLTLLFALTACRGEGLRTLHTEEPIQTDRALYHARPLTDEPGDRYGFMLVAQLTNPRDEVLYLARCSEESALPTYGVHAESGEWPHGAAYNPAWACPANENPIVLQPGETRSDTLLLAGPHAADSRTRETRGAFSGRFQLRYDAYPCRIAWECSGARVELFSNWFEVRLRP